MLNFNKKKYVSFDNLKSFNGLLQSSLKEKIDGYKSEINVKVDERFKVLSGQQQKDSEVIDAREGQVSLSENLKTYVKKEEFVTEYEHLNEKFTSEIEEIKPNVNANTEYINTNKSAIQRVIDFVDAFRCELSLGEIGYAKFPDIFGGLLLQWGIVRIPKESLGGGSYFVNYPKVFTYCFNIIGSFDASDDKTNVRIIPGFIRKNNNSSFRYRTSKLGLPGEGDINEVILSWFAIGR